MMALRRNLTRPLFYGLWSLSCSSAATCRFYSESRIACIHRPPDNWALEPIVRFAPAVRKPLRRGGVRVACISASGGSQPLGEMEPCS